MDKVFEKDKCVVYDNVLSPEAFIPVPNATV